MKFEQFDILRATEIAKGAIAFDAEVNGIKIYGMKVCTKKADNTEFISFPSYKGNDGNYYNNVWFPIGTNQTAKIIAKVKKKLSESVEEADDLPF